MIRVRDVHKTYRRGGADVHALRGVDLDVAAGQVLAITGRSGAGKSTLLNVMAGLLRADRGTIEVDGLDVTSAKDAELIGLRRDTVGVIYQEFALLPLLTAEENVGLPLRIARTDVKQRDAVVAELLDRVGLSQHARQRPDELSGRAAAAGRDRARPRHLAAGAAGRRADRSARLQQTGAHVMDLLRQLVDQEAPPRSSRPTTRRSQQSRRGRPPRDGMRAHRVGLVTVGACR